jgi:hypothetical protein
MLTAQPRTRDIPKPAEPITDPRKLAGVLAAVVTNYPHVMARTRWAQARLADGKLADLVEDPSAVAFCATGVIDRLYANGVTTGAAAEELHTLLTSELLSQGKGHLAAWWENETGWDPTAADYAALLRRVAEA